MKTVEELLPHLLADPEVRREVDRYRLVISQITDASLLALALVVNEESRRRDERDRRRKERELEIADRRRSARIGR